jgi:hypothetical protein
VGCNGSQMHPVVSGYWGALDNESCILALPYTEMSDFSPTLMMECWGSAWCGVHGDRTASFPTKPGHQYTTNNGRHVVTTLA